MAHTSAIVGMAAAIGRRFAAAWAGSLAARALRATLRVLAVAWSSSVPGRLLGERDRWASALETSAVVRVARTAASPLSALRPFAGGSVILRRLPFERFPAGFALVFPFLPTSLDAALIWAAAALFGLHRWSQGEPILGRHPALVALGFFAVFIAGAAAASVTPAASLVALVLWLSWFLLFWVSEEAATRASIRGSQWGLALGAALVALVGLAQAHAGIQTRASWIDEQTNPGLTTRVFAVFDDPNMLAAYFTCTLPAAIALVLSERRWLLRGAAFVCLGIALACDVYTFSRGGWLAMVVAFAVLGGLWRPRYLPLVWGGLAAVLAAVVALGPQALQVRVDSLVGGQDSSIQYRISIWTGVLHMVRDNLWTGVGLGQYAFGAVYPHYMLAGTEAAHAHNIYLELLAEIGLPGFLAFLLFAAVLCTTLLRAALTKVSSASGETARLAAAAALAGTVALFFEGLTDNVWYSPRAAMALWLVTGLGLASGRAYAVRRADELQSLAAQGEGGAPACESRTS